MTGKTDFHMPKSRQKQAHIFAAGFAAMIAVMAVAIATDYLMTIMIAMMVTVPVVAVGLFTTASMSSSGVSDRGSVAWGFAMSALMAVLIWAMYFGASHYSAFVS